MEHKGRNKQYKIMDEEKNVCTDCESEEEEEEE